LIGFSTEEVKKLDFNWIDYLIFSHVEVMIGIVRSGVVNFFWCLVVG
jgi:hypothetical protein